MGEVSYKGHRYPAEIIAHCVWLYHRFPLNFHEVKELMLVRGVICPTRRSGSGVPSSGRNTPAGCAAAGNGPPTSGISTRCS